jgi:hypothetical protein
MVQYSSGEGQWYNIAAEQKGVTYPACPNLLASEVNFLKHKKQWISTLNTCETFANVS